MASVVKGQIIRPDLKQYDGINTSHERKDSSGGVVSGLKIGDHVDVISVYGGGSDFSSVAINNAINSVGTNNTDFDFSPGSWEIRSNTTIPANISCYLSRGCVFNVNSGVTLTISGAVYSDSDDWFTGSGSVVVKGLGQVGVRRSISDLRDITPSISNLIIDVQFHTSAGSGGGRFYSVTGAASGTYTDDDGLTIVPTGGNGSSAWLRLLTNGIIMPEFFGDAPDTSIQAAIDAANANGGGIVRCKEGQTYTMTSLPIVKANVELDMNGATFNATLGSGNVYGTRLGNYSKLRNGTINVTSSGSPSSQRIFHACISIGEANGAGGTVASPSTYSTVHDFVIENMTLSTTRARNPVIQGMGDIYNGEIRNINIPTSSNHSGIHLDWSDIGINVSSSDIPGTRTSFDAGDNYTTHPHNILIENISCGDLSVASSSDVGSNIVRLSGCYNITCRNLEAESIGLTGYRHVGGDLGFEFAPASVKPHAYKGNILENMVLKNVQSSGPNGCYIDTFADNIYAAQFTDSYSPLEDPMYQGDVVVKNSSIVGPNTDTLYGIRIIQAKGVTIEHCNIRKWTQGIYIDEFTEDIHIYDNKISANRTNGIRIGGSLLREDTKDTYIRHNKIFGNGTNATGYGIRLHRGRNVNIDSNTFGTLSETTQVSGVLTDNDGPATFNVNVNNNHTLGATGSAYTLSASTPDDPYEYRQIGSFNNNTADTSIVSLVTSPTYLPFYSLLNNRNRPNRNWWNPNSGSPTNGTWYKSEILFRSEPAASSHAAHTVVTSGTFGTLSGLTNASTTNGSAIVTMSLASKTADTTENSYQITINDATNIRAGLKCSISAAGITNAMILSVSGTTLQLDTKANATQTGGAFVTAGVIEGEVISLNTTPAIAGAIVMKIDGNSVTLGTSASSTESSRTASYTTPVFKTWANLSA